MSDHLKDFIATIAIIFIGLALDFFIGLNIGIIFFPFIFSLRYFYCYFFEKPLYQRGWASQCEKLVWGIGFVLVFFGINIYHIFFR